MLPLPFCSLRLSLTAVLAGPISAFFMSAPGQAADQKDVKDASEVLSIGNRREVFWDGALVDRQKTAATLRMHSPQPREVVLEHGAPWEGDGCDFHCRTTTLIPPHDVS
jgi:hypothetical protein